MKLRRRIKRSIRAKLTGRWTTFLDFPTFRPNSTGPSRQMTDLTIFGVNSIIPRLQDFLEKRPGSPETNVKDINVFALDDVTNKHVGTLDELFRKHGSDKSRKHNYHLLLAYILRDPTKVDRILEIGMGTNNKDVVSNMGSRGQPGASLRAFRDFLPHATIYGADFDKRILFTEDRIETHFVDQNDPKTLSELSDILPEEFDLVIDDGLHAPHANIATMTMVLPKLKPGGWFVIEDIADAAIPVWQVVSHLMPAEYSAQIVQTRCSIVFAVQRFPKDPPTD